MSLGSGCGGSGGRGCENVGVGVDVDVCVGVGVSVGIEKVKLTCQASAGLLTSQAKTMPSSVPPRMSPPGEWGPARAQTPDSASVSSCCG